MRPLQSIAMGLVLILLSARFHGYDALPDPVGWLLVLLGVVRLPVGLLRRGHLAGLAGLAGAISVPLWLPHVTDALDAAHPSLVWTANLPQLGFAALLCHTLAQQATRATDLRSARWLQLAMVGFVVFALLPVLVFGGGVTTLEVPAYVGASLALMMLIWMLFAYSARPWILPKVAPADPAAP